MVSVNRKTTFDWINDFKLEMPWKFGVYTVSMNLPLDYSLHLDDTTFKSGMWKFNEEDLLELAIRSPSYEEEPRKICELMQGVMYGVGTTHGQMYNKYVLGIYRNESTQHPGVVSFELGPVVWIIYNSYGPWPAIFKKKDLNNTNYLTYCQKSSNVFVWDNKCGMIRADYDEYEYH